MFSKPVEILLAEDSLADVVLMKKILKQTTTPKNLYVVNNGIEAMNFLHQEGEYEQKPRPDLILLDLNLPQKNGLEVLKEIKSDLKFKAIPVIILSTSENNKDIVECYNYYANSYLTKPIDLKEFYQCMEAIDNFWFKFVRYPLN
ncbi:two-component system response regulator [Geminocystis sp. NIES-3708]|uniref:response regulator n=1 Tax=Geminocystis sp. NIES-3708 TaxID=1615909 RepID=UPI0005FC59AF|nr:response regulator [Geminocystis sp. NIES-3708]BAQ62806.1 two-component system response regulator [Geminocystis sp. NIES-3708]